MPVEERHLSDSADPHAELAAAEAEERLLRVLAKLPRLRREVFLMRGQQGSDYNQVAAALGTTPGAAAAA